MKRGTLKTIIQVGALPVIALVIGVGDLAYDLLKEQRTSAKTEELADLMPVVGHPLGAAHGTGHGLTPAVQGMPLTQPGSALNASISSDTRTISPSAMALAAAAEGEPDADVFDFRKTRDGQHLKVSFRALSNYAYPIPEPAELREASNPEGLLDEIPDPISDLDGQDVVLVGFMVPIDVDSRGRIQSFALSQDQMFCCFGVPPAMNEWVMVHMEKSGTEYVADMPIAVYGTMTVGPEVEDGHVMSLYRLNGHEVVDVRNLVQ